MIAGRERRPRQEGWCRIWLSGALTPPLAGLVLVAAFARDWPSGDGPGTLARMLDSLAPQLLLLALPGLPALALLGARRGFVLVAGLWLIVAVSLAGGHVARSVAPMPPDEAELTLLWFNMLGQNATPPERLVRALADSPADIVLLAEARPLRGSAAALAEVFPHRLGCADGARCDLMLLSRKPLEEARLHAIGRMREHRMITARVPLPGGRSVSLTGVHLVKPWLHGIAEPEETDLAMALSRRDGPLVLAGDFNAAPWSHRVQTFMRHHGLSGARWPRATWPKAAGPFGVPIDLVLTRGVAMSTPRPWGRALGSNHLGLLVGLRVPTSAAAAGVPAEAAVTAR